MLNMMNEKINSLILSYKTQNDMLKKELDEIKSSLQNHTFTKYENDEVEDEEDTTYNEEENNNSDDIKITNNKNFMSRTPI